ncbi:MAG: NgoFVII family restriction endonuclease [Elusimicrobia bacterium]|nr:NgoFVII family restriction endonuclease [Elusimicrobiota bacterium]
MLLTSKIPPLNSSLYDHGFTDTFFGLMHRARRVVIATGYISADSISELHETFEINKEALKALHLELFVGMHYFEGITKIQLEALKSLNMFLGQNSAGNIRIVNQFKFHGKVYCFFDEKKPSACLIGSSNLNNISKKHPNFEVDVLVEDTGILNNVRTMLGDLRERASIDLAEWTDPKDIPLPSPLENYGSSDKISDSDLRALIANKTDISFDIPLKPEQKSNLNAFFGKGREAKNGLIIPRPWYEVELIVPKEITTNNNYPKGDFTLITQDRWKFDCKTSGDYYKNLRSSNDLQILGRWIKGEMENKGVLKPRELITADTIQKFGHSSLKITKINNGSSTWLAGW